MSNVKKPEVVNTGGVLDKIMAHKAEEVAARKRVRPINALLEGLEKATPGRLETAFQSDRPNRLILEIKPSSPSAGVLASLLDLPALLEVYQRYGLAISVLTDETYFGGSLDLLRQVRQNVSVPVLRKDFIFDPYQVAEARLVGADAVLLIVKALSDSQLGELSENIRQWGMTPLIEIQDETELERAMAVQPSILLINNRNLQTLAMDLDTTSRLAPLIPQGVIRVSASGIESRADLERLKPFCDGFLIGSLLMRQPSPAHLEKTLQELTQ
jgi:indole-3-glycerol phosphate synthase